MQAMPSKNTSFHSTIFRANANTASIPPSVPLSRLTDNVLDGTSSAHIEELQKAWEVDPDSVDESGDNFFRNFGGQTGTSTGVTGQTRQENAEIVWCQEEPMNMGASSYIAPRLCTAMKATGRGSWEDIKFVGRGPSASTATGFAQVHKSEQAEIFQFAMKPQPVKLVC